MATNIDTHADHYSSLSQIPLVPTKKPSATRSFGLNTLTKLERCLVILNVGLIVILLPLVVTSVHKITKIEGALDLKLDNHTGFLVLVDDVWNATQKIQKNIGGISETQQLMKDKQNDFEEKMGEIVCSIGSKSSVKSVVGEINITIPSATEGEELHYKVNCFGPCKDIEIKLWVNGEDVDLFASMSGPITYLQDNTRAELCKKRSTGSTEYCPSFNVADSSFYTLVHAYKPHRSGSISFTGSNLISVTNTTEQEPEMSQCQQKGLYYDISILKISINSSTQQTRDAIENKLENHASSLDKIYDILELANRTQLIVDGINVTHQEIKGTQNDLDQKLEEIVCSIGFNTSVMPAEVVTTSPIRKDVPAGSRRNFYHYKVFCQGPCEDVLVDLRVSGDADLYVSKTEDADSSNRLCKSDGGSGNERCRTPSNTDVSSMYAIIHAHRDHTTGSITFTGSKMISVTNANQTQEIPTVLNQRCDKIGLVQKIENITGAIDQTHQEAKGDMSNLDSKVDSTKAKVEELKDKWGSGELKIEELKSSHHEIKEKQTAIDGKIKEILEAINGLKSLIPQTETTTPTITEYEVEPDE